MDEAIGPAQSPSDRRKYRRFQLECPVRVRFPSAGLSPDVEAVSKNVSIGGLLLDWSLPIPLGKAVEFTLTLQGPSMLRPILLVGAGEIVRVQTAETKERCGLAVACSQPISEIEEHLLATGGQAD